MNAFTDKVVLVTGGTSGIGLATALAFAREGARVVVAGRRAAEGAETVAAIEEAGGQGLFVRADIAIEADVAAMVAQTVESFGGLHIAFNNAGAFPAPGPVTEVTAETIDYVLGVNVRGTALCLKHEIPALLASGGGAIVNTASYLGLRPSAGAAAIYNASKSAVIGLTKSVALEVAARGVRVNVVCPGVIATPMNEAYRQEAEGRAFLDGLQPAGRVGRAEEIAAAVLYLCSPGAAFTTGAVLSVDGGISV